jgi:hypothetical protein
MATFSLWKDFESVKQFAYKANSIRKIKTRMNGIQRELFSRFQPYKSSGTWEGKDLLVI